MRPGSNTGKDEVFDTLAAPSLAASLKLGDFGIGLAFVAPMSGSRELEAERCLQGQPDVSGRPRLARPAGT